MDKDYTIGLARRGVMIEMVRHNNKNIVIIPVDIL